MRRWEFGDWHVTRVPDPGFELIVPQIDATKETLRRSPWLHPHFVTDDWDLRVSSSTILLRSRDGMIVVDPWLAFDDPARHEQRILELHTSGAIPIDVDFVVNTHIDGIGANFGPGSERPAFPRARYLLPVGEREPLLAGKYPGAELLSSVTEWVDRPTEILTGVHTEDLPGHNPGHMGVSIGSPARALIVGHLFLHPAQIANPSSMQGDHDPETLKATRLEVLERAERDHLTLIGPLWADPGAGKIVRDGDGFCLVPVD